MDYYGGDFDAVPAADATECYNRCFDTRPLCRAFTIHDGVCYKKFSVSTPTPCPDCISGIYDAYLWVAIQKKCQAFCQALFFLFFGGGGRSTHPHCAQTNANPRGWVRRVVLGWAPTPGPKIK